MHHLHRCYNFDTPLGTASSVGRVKVRTPPSHFAFTEEDRFLLSDFARTLIDVAWRIAALIIS
jgi:hypothetical protein